MKPNAKDIVISKEILDVFRNSVRVVGKPSVGIYPLEARQLLRIKELVPELFANEAILKKYDLGLSYRGKTMKADFAKLKIEFSEDRIIKIPLVTVPVPWQMLKRANIDYRKIGLCLTPKHQ
jgi:hypothetical protein